MVVVIIGNFMTLYCLTTIKEMRTITGIFLTNLAITDLGVGFIALPLSLAASVEHFLLHKRWFCILNGVGLVLFVVASLLTLAAISIQKYATVGYRMQSAFTRRKAYYTVLLIWIVASVFAVGPAAGWSRYSFSTGGHQCAPYLDNASGNSYFLALIAMAIVFPTITMTFCYFKLYQMTRSHLRRMRASAIVQGTSGRDMGLLSAVESRLVHTLIIMMLAFFFCWFPVILLIILKVSHVETPHIFETLVLLSAYGNSAVNPILYAMRQRDFQRGFRKIYHAICGSYQIEQEIRH